MASCNPGYMPGVGTELSLDQAEEKLLNKDNKEHFQAFTGSVMETGQVIYYEILVTANQQARVILKPSEMHMAIA